MSKEIKSDFNSYDKDGSTLSIIYMEQGYKDNYSICGAYLSLAYAGQGKPVFLY